mmetsp:Transcript_23935/g.71047  ORF Transcript_23935/g.71047 Transcript_23935/m.71047 type:complete len:278 (-) Transcript_23935:32-865(-)
MRRVHGAVGAVESAEASRRVLARLDCVGRAHELAPGLDRATARQRKRPDWPRGHELDEAREERLAHVLAVKLFGAAASQLQLLLRDDREARHLDKLLDLVGLTGRGRVGLDEPKRPFGLRCRQRCVGEGGTREEELDLLGGGVGRLAAMQRVAQVVRAVCGAHAERRNGAVVVGGTQQLAPLCHRGLLAQHQRLHRPAGHEVHQLGVELFARVLHVQLLCPLLCELHALLSQDAEAMLLDAQLNFLSLSGPHCVRLDQSKRLLHGEAHPGGLIVCIH